MMPWFDSHIPLRATEWEKDVERVYHDVLRAGITGMLIPGVQVALAVADEACAGIARGYLAPGLHPDYADLWSSGIAKRLTLLTAEPEVVAIAEIGLDNVAGPDPAAQEFRVHNTYFHGVAGQYTYF
jgi:TatD DNase family protein